MQRIQVDGKHFVAGADGRFPVRGVTYGTFAPRSDGARFPERDRVKRDFVDMAEAGFTVVRTYTSPPDDLLDLAADTGLRLLVDVFYPDWRYLVGASERDRRAVAREARETVRREARRLADYEQVFALSLGNEIPADVVRWVGTRSTADLIEELAEVAREEDPERLVTYANYPTAEYLPLDGLDFLTFNVFLEQQSDFRRYLTRLQHLAGQRPLVLGEVGLDSGGTREGEEGQALALDWMLETVLDRGLAGACVFSWTDEWWVGEAAVEGWHFGLTRADRSPRPSLEVAEAWNRRTVADLDWPWPSMSVVICAHNAASTLDECLRHTCALEYPGLEVVVVDDGSEDGTPEIASGYERVRLVRIEHGGLSEARNAGLRAATKEVVAYLDADAYPPPEWPYYLALGFDGPLVGGVGGPNVPPPDDPPKAHQVARSPGGPVHVLIADDRAEHVPGCNMAFWRTEVLEEVGGFDSIYDAAGDDVDLCWRVLDRGWEIGFHPAALVWHHRRPGRRAYLRQQQGYGRAEALVEARHPDRFTPVGTARWRGHIYTLGPSLARGRVYRGAYGEAAYQSVYRGGGHVLDLVHQLGVPLGVLLVATAPLAVLSPLLSLPAGLGLLGLTSLAGVDVVRSRAPADYRGSRLRFRAGVALLHLLQPLARLWGRARHSMPARRTFTPREGLPGPARRTGRVLVLPLERPRGDVARAVVNALRRSGRRVRPATGWEDHDGRVIGSTLVEGDVVTSGHPEGCAQVRLRLRPRWGRMVVLGGTSIALAAGGLAPVAAILGGVGVGEAVRGVVRAGPGALTVIARACDGSR